MKNKKVKNSTKNSTKNSAQSSAQKNAHYKDAYRQNTIDEEHIRAEQKKRFTEYQNLDKIGEIALHYGFTPAKSPEIKKSDLDIAKNFIDEDSILPLHVEEKIALLRMYTENNMQDLPQPVMLYLKDPFKKNGGHHNDQGHHSHHDHQSHHRYANLEIIGNSKSIAEATLIHVAKVMLNEEGYSDISVDVNSVGDKDSISRFSHDLTAYYRKNINDMHPECRQLFKKDPFALLASTNEHCKEINDAAPQTLNYLSETSRNHFKETLEYLETFGIPYRINNALVGNRYYCTETVFTITNNAHHHEILAIGVRYDGLAKKIGLKKEIQGVSISILIKGNKPELRKEVKKVLKPRVSFVQLGFESKLLSLGVLELLRQAHIPVYQALTKDRLAAQVSIVEKYHIPYALIMGQKEAIEHSVIVRDTATHAQDSVLLTELIHYMNTLGV